MPVLVLVVSAEPTSPEIVVCNVSPLVLNVQPPETPNVVNAQLDFTWKDLYVRLALRKFLNVQPVRTLRLVLLVNQPILSMEGLVHLAKTDVIPVRTHRPVILALLENTSIQVTFVFPVSLPVLYVQPKVLVVLVPMDIT
jgi:hypothetical protein